MTASHQPRCHRVKAIAQGSIGDTGIVPKAFFNGIDPTRTWATCPHLAQCFLRLANLPSYPIDRLSRYEYALWRQVAQILFALDNLNRRKPQERRPALVRGSAAHRPDEDDYRYGDD